ncbi:MAG: YfcE family phosphodiesterase [Firmicutes bacterium]|jgi:putative phosphoesterase|nr:YfcE family phosphodiesterase [Bacillota bacterium]
MQEVRYVLKNGLIGVVSDTHIPARASFLPSRLIGLLEGVDLILHAGDIEEESVLDELRVLAPVEAVAGNMDPLYLKMKLGVEKIVHLGEISLGLVHGSGIPRGAADLVLQKFNGYRIHGLVFGHSHVPFLEQRGDVLLLNPGSVGDPRRGSTPSCALLNIEGGKLQAEIIRL